MASPVEQESLWMGGVRLFLAHARGWMQRAAWFVLILIPFNAWKIHDIGPYYEKLRPFYGKLFDVLSEGQDVDAIQSINDQMQAIPSPSSYPDIAVMAVSAAALYFFCVYYFTCAPIESAPRLNPKGFVFSFFKMMQKYVIIVGVPAFFFALGAVLFFVPDAILTRVFHLENGALEIIFAVMALLMTGSGLYFFCRYALVFPLAVMGIKPALKLSGVLTKGGLLRMAWGYAAITTVMLPPAIVLVAVPTTAGTSPPLTLIELATVVAASQILIMGLFASFSCAALAILTREKQAADPGFKLLSST